MILLVRVLDPKVLRLHGHSLDEKRGKVQNFIIKYRNHVYPVSQTQNEDSKDWPLNHRDFTKNIGSLRRWKTNSSVMGDDSTSKNQG